MSHIPLHLCLTASEILTRLGWERVSHGSPMAFLKFEWNEDSPRFFDRSHKVNKYVLTVCQNNSHGKTNRILLGTRDAEMVQVLYYGFSKSLVGVSR